MTRSINGRGSPAGRAPTGPPRRRPAARSRRAGAARARATPPPTPPATSAPFRTSPAWPARASAVPWKRARNSLGREPDQLPEVERRGGAPGGARGRSWTPSPGSTGRRSGSRRSRSPIAPSARPRPPAPPRAARWSGRRCRAARRRAPAREWRRSGRRACRRRSRRSAPGAARRARGPGRGGPPRAAPSCPAPVVMRQPFLPIQPSPARCAQTFSMTGPTSTEGSARASGSRPWIAATRTFSFFLMTVW